MLFHRLYSGMQARDRAFVIALAGLAAALLSAINADQAFAELSSTHNLQDAAAVADGAPRTFSRSMSESVSVASNFGDQGVRIPRVFNVGISDGLSITTSPSSPASNSATSPARTNSFTGAGRAEERLGPRNPFESRSEPGSTGTASGTTEESKESASYDIETILSMVGQELFSSDDSEPDDNSPQIVVLQSSPTLYMDALYGAYGLAVIVLATSKTSTARVVARRIAKRSAAKEVVVARIGRTIVLISVGVVVAVATSAGMTNTSAEGPIPTYVGVGTAAAGGGAVTPTLPGSLQTDDILLMFVETANQNAVISNQNGLTWIEVTNSPQSTTATRLTVFWARYDGSAGNPTVQDSGNHNLAIIHAFRGVITTGDPWDVTSGNTQTSGTSLSATGATTTSANTLVVIAAALDDDTDNFGATWTNADLANIAERSDSGTTAGNDGRLGVVTGEKASAGAYGATTNTVGAGTRAMMTIALKPAPLSATGSPSETVTLTDAIGIAADRQEPLVQQGLLSLTATSQDISITPINPSKAMVLFSARSADSGPDNLQVTARLVDGATLRFEKYDIVQTDIEWQVIYSPDFSVQSGEESYITTDSSLSVDITSVDLSESFIVVYNRLNSGASADNVEGFWTGRFTDADAISLERGATGIAGVISWQVVSIEGASVQSGSLDLALVASNTDSITSVSTSNSFLIFSARTAGDTGLDVTSVRGVITDPTTLTFSRIASTGTASVEWFVIEWDRFSVQEDQTTVSGSSAVDQTVSAVDSLSRTFVWHSQDSTGGGTTFANSVLTSALTNTTNLQFLKGTGSQTQVVQWQVVEITIPQVYSEDVSDSILLDVDIQAAISVSVSTSSTITILDSIDADVTVTPDSNVAGMAYASTTGNGINYPKYREWNPTTKTWGAEVELESAGSPVRTAWIEFSPVSTKRVIIALSDDGTLDSYVCDFACETPGNWVVNHDVADLWSTALDAQKRPFDIEFENTSGDLMLVYDRVDGDLVDTDIFYRIMPDSDTAFGDEQSFNDSDLAAPDIVYNFFRLDSRRTTGSNDLGLIALSETNSRAIAWYWDGTIETFENELLLSSSMSTQDDYEAIGIGFETYTGDMVAVAGEGSVVKSYQFSSGSWDAGTTVTTLSVGTVQWMRFVANQNAGTTLIQLVASGSSGGLDTAVWDGTAWDGYSGGTRHDATIDSTSIRAFDWAWDNAGDATRGILVWSSSSGVVTYKRYTATDTWTATKTFSDDGTTHGWVSLNEHFNPTSADSVSVLGAVIDADSDISQMRWDGSANEPHAWDDDGATTSGTSTSESFHVDFRRSPVLKKFPSQTVTIIDSISVQKNLSFTTSDTLTVADTIVGEKGSPTDSAKFGAVYRSNTGGPLLNSPKYREWDPATQAWSDEVVLPNTGSPVRDAQIRFSPSSALRVVVSHSDSGALNLFVCDNACTSASSWTLLEANFADTGTPVAGKPYKPYDIMFETTGKRLVIVYDKEGTAEDDFYYRTFDGTTLSAETGVNLGGSADSEDLRYLSLAPHPTTDEMALAVLDATNSKSYGVIWNGSSWGNVQTVSSALSTENKDGESVGVAYETATGAALVFSGNGQNSAAYSRWTGSSWSSVSTVNPDTTLSTEHVKFVSLKADPSGSSSDIMVCQLDQSNDDLHLTCAEFVAGTPGTWNTITSTIGTTAGRAFDFAYHPSSGKGMLVSSSGASGTLDYRVWSGSSFGGAATVQAAGTHKWVFGLSATSATDVVNGMFLKSNSNFDTGGMKYKADVTTLVGDSALTSDSFNDTFESMHMDVQRSKVVRRAASDTLTVTESVTGEFTTGRLVTETLSVADTIAKSVVKQLSESVSIADAIAKSTSREVDDAIAIADAITPTAGRSVADTLTIDDAISRSVSLAVEDSVVLTDSISTTALRSATDALTIDDAISTRVTRAIDDGISVTDVISKSTTRSVSDDLAVNDDLTPTISRTASDSLSITDTITRSVSRTMTETIEIADEITPTAGRPIADTITVTDTISHSVSRATSDSITLTDSVSTAVSRSMTDSIAATDTISTRVTRTIADDIAVTDDIASDTIALVSETVTVTDAISMSVTRSVDDSLTVEDSAAKSVAINVSDTLALDVAVTGFTGFAGSMSDTVAVTDSVAMTVSRSIAETLAVADAASTNSIRNISDTVTIADDIPATVSRAVADTIVIADAITPTTGRAVSDTATLEDSVAMHVTRSIADSLVIADAMTPTTDHTVSDAIAVTDAVSQSVSRATADSVTLTDSIDVTVSRSIADSVVATDTISTRVTRSLSDSLTVAETIASTASRSVADDLVVADDISSSVTRSVDDSLAVADAVSTNAVRNISDTVMVSDEIPTSVSRAADDSITVSDDIATSVSRAIEDRLSVADTIADTPMPAVADSIAVADSVSMSVSRSLADSVSVTDLATPTSQSALEETVTLSDAISMHVTRALAEEVAITDTTTAGALALMSEAVTIADAISTHVTRSVSDSVTVEDDAAKSVTVFISDSVGTADSAVAFPGYAVSITETLTITDAAETAATRSVQETLAIADTVSTNVHYYLAMEDSLAAGDVISINGEVVIFEAIAVADSVSMHVTRALSDEVTVADAAGAGTGGSVNDSLAVTDAVSMHVTRAIVDTISIADEFGPDQPGLEDTVGIADAITDISISWNRNFEEELTLESCGPVSCGWMLDFDESLTLGAEFDIPKIEDELTITDNITLGPNDLSAVPPVEDEIEISDSVTGVILGILVVDDHSSIGNLPSTELTGNYTYTGDAEDLVYSILDIPIPINSTTLRPNLPEDISILRTYYVPITPTTEIPGEHVIISEIHSEVPAASNMFLRINFEETPALSGEDFIKILDIEFTPAVESTDFALVVSLMDGPPAPGGVQSPTPSEAIRPIYIDVKWVGDFPGVEDPSVQEYYENPPTFTFQVNDEWVEENSADVDSNGVPLLKLWLLDETDNVWEQITTIDRPDGGEDGTYTFVATLPHFSDYAITANPVSTSTGGGGGGGSDEEQFTVNLVDALGLFESPKGQAIEIIDIPVGIKYTANLLDSVVISSRPVAYNTFEILKDVEVSITIVDVRQETAFPPSAVAELETLIVNRGDTHEEFTLNFWYNDQTGERRWNLSLFVEVDPHESKTIPVEIPFTEPGMYRVTAEARGVPGNELLESTQLTVIIPWLSVYIYVLITVAVAILGGSGLAIALYMARNATLIAAGAGAGAAILIAAKRHKPRVRVAEWKEGAEDDDYDLLVNVTLANGKEGWLKPGELAGSFEFEIINRSRSKQEFVLAYYLEDVAGIRAPESAGVVRIDGHKEELRRDRVVLPSRGTYVLCVEARTQKGEVLSRDRVAVRSA